MHDKIDDEKKKKKRKRKMKKNYHATDIDGESTVVDSDGDDIVDVDDDGCFVKPTSSSISGKKLKISSKK